MRVEADQMSALVQHGERIISSMQTLGCITCLCNRGHSVHMVMHKFCG